MCLLRQWVLLGLWLKWNILWKNNVPLLVNYLGPHLSLESAMMVIPCTYLYLLATRSRPSLHQSQDVEAHVVLAAPSEAEAKSWGAAIQVDTVIPGITFGTRPLTLPASVSEFGLGGFGKACWVWGRWYWSCQSNYFELCGHRCAMTDHYLWCNFTWGSENDCLQQTTNNCPTIYLDAVRGRTMKCTSTWWQ